MVCSTREVELIVKSDSKAGKVATHQQGSSLVVSEQEEQCRTAEGNKGQEQTNDHQAGP